MSGKGKKANCNKIRYACIHIMENYTTVKNKLTTATYINMDKSQKHNMEKNNQVLDNYIQFVFIL